jgi:ceramide glucosyltransferase
LGYLAYAIWRVSRFPAPRDPAGTFSPPITILKPVCGLDPGLYENLRSFCEQEYTAYQVIFAARDASDPAVAVVRKLIELHPHRDMTLVIDATAIGSNRKINNLINMYRIAKYNIVAVADSDMRVDRHYLQALAADFAHPEVGAVTCLYRGVPLRGLPSLLSAMWINEWFLPSVLVALSFKPLDFCFGSTMAVRREALAAIGGFEVLASQLADDHLLGKLISNAGYQVKLSPYIVDNIIFEPSLKSAWQHELRWARTLFSLEPLGYSLSVITYAVPLALLCSLIDEHTIDLDWPDFVLISSAVGLRMLMHMIVKWRLHIRGWATPWVAPLRDFMSFFVWAASFFGRGISWRGQRFSVDKNGQLLPQQG